jgi:hypothetical protein
MKISLYHSFKTTIETIPVQAIRRTLERESRMLGEDLVCQRPVPIDETSSILNFCRFVQSLSEGQPGGEFAAAVPPKHRTFYRQTLARLVAANELPANAVTEFDLAQADERIAQSVHNN